MVLLPGAGGADEGHGLAGLHMEGNALQHPLAGDVAEPDVLNSMSPFTSSSSTASGASTIWG